MVNSCVNPDCGNELKTLNAGHFYAVERRSANTEFFWLCPTCVAEFTLCLDVKGSLVVRPRSGTEFRQSPHPDSRLLLLSDVGGYTLSYQSIRRRELASSGGSVYINRHPDPLQRELL
jgi:hypothetical protein